jgi:hypothetical protein
VISHAHRCIFVHIPRTGGTSIENVIWPGERTEADLWMGFVSKYRNKYQTGGLQHLLATQIRREVGDGLFTAYFKFTFVRNPWDRAVSQYMLTRRRKDLQEYIGMSGGDSFERYLELISRREHVQWTPQHRFIFDGEGRLLVDYVGRFESLERDAAGVFERIGVGGALPHAHATERLSTATYYNRCTIERVAQIYAQDIEVFGYSGAAPAIAP